MMLQRALHLDRVVLPQPSRPLHIGEQERHRPRRALRHGLILPHSAGRSVAGLPAGTVQLLCGEGAELVPLLATDDRIFDGVCRQHGALRAQTVEEAFEWAATFAPQPLPRGRRVVVFPTAGGWGVLAADACDDVRFTKDLYHRAREVFQGAITLGVADVSAYQTLPPAPTATVLAVMRLPALAARRSKSIWVTAGSDRVSSVLVATTPGGESGRMNTPAY